MACPARAAPLSTPLARSRCDRAFRRVGGRLGEEKLRVGPTRELQFLGTEHELLHRSSPLSCWLSTGSVVGFRRQTNGPRIRWSGSAALGATPGSASPVVTSRDLDPRRRQ